MKNLVSILILFASFNLFAQTAEKASDEPKDNFIHKNCRKAKDDCVSMDMNILDKSLIEENSDSTYTFRLFGKLDKKKEAEHILKLQGKESCPSTAVGTVAVLGFSKEGNPIVLTDEGPFEIRTKLATVGSYALELYNTESQSRTPVLTRSAKLDRYAIVRTQFDASGRIYFLDGFECFEYRKNSTFRKVETQRCNNKKKEISDFAKFEKLILRPSEKAYELKDSKYILITESKCS